MAGLSTLCASGTRCTRFGSGYVRPAPRTTNPLRKRCPPCATSSCGASATRVSVGAGSLSSWRALGTCRQTRPFGRPWKSPQGRWPRRPGGGPARGRWCSLTRCLRCSFPGCRTWLRTTVGVAGEPRSSASSTSPAASARTHACTWATAAGTWNWRCKASLREPHAGRAFPPPPLPGALGVPSSEGARWSAPSARCPTRRAPGP
mmetsp:Transcript_8969/g.27243  ORF Transcript_8969/g.27243 Transcript_8969/m.27243 type:complete len:204 (-) Transcript_8969:426-1037(-)